MTWSSCTMHATGRRWRILLLRTWQPYPSIFTNGSSSSVQQRLCWQPSIATTQRHDVSFTCLSTDRLYRFCAKLTYLGIKQDWAHTFRRHLESLRKKLTSCVGLLRRSADQAGVRMPQYSAQPPLP